MKQTDGGIDSDPGFVAGSQHGTRGDATADGRG
jgi:hypothetical protein